MDLVSVVIPTFNRADVVVCAIDSALRQTYNNIEILIIDDGSTDNTAELVRDFGGRVKYLNKINGGVSSARNYGIIHSTGKIIAFLDSDDEWLPDKLKKQMDLLHDNPAFGMVLCDCYFMNSERTVTGRSFRRNALPRDGSILGDVLMSSSLVPSSVLVKKEILIDVGCFDEELKTAEDLDLHLRIAAKYNICLLPEPLVMIMRGNEGLSALSSTYDDHVKVLERFAGQHCNEIAPIDVKKALFKAYTSAANGKYWANDWISGAKYTLLAGKCASTPNDFLTFGKLGIKSLKYLFRKI